VLRDEVALMLVLSTPVYFTVYKVRTVKTEYFDYSYAAYYVDS
jgi:hypothetical protein